MPAAKVRARTTSGGWEVVKPQTQCFQESWKTVKGTETPVGRGVKLKYRSLIETRLSYKAVAEELVRRCAGGARSPAGGELMKRFQTVQAWHYPNP